MYDSWLIVRWLTVEWYRYLVSDLHSTRLATRWGVLRCRISGHRPGVNFYTMSGDEPDMRCQGCGENLG